MRSFLTDLLGNCFKQWGRKKVFLTAPTGLGKTTFVVKTLLPYMEAKKSPYERKKVLIASNRKLLRDQYWHSLIMEYDRYREFRESVEVKTYQQLAEEIRNQDVDDLARRYSMIICDECHFFYADADFNGFDTYVVLQAILYIWFDLPIVFMSATMKEVEPLIEETIAECRKVISRKYPRMDTSCFEIIRHDFSYLEDYSNFECIAVPDEETLCAEIGVASGKTIIFIDDCAAAERMGKKIQAAGNLNKKDVATLNAENLDNAGNSEVVKALVMNHLCLPKVIITTSVLDNGISIEDPEVQNVVIITESRISFLQMLGRVRSGYTEKINLYLLLRPASYFAQREENYRAMVEEIAKVSKMNCNFNRFSIINIAWGEDRLAKIYRKIFTPCPEKLAYLCYGRECVRISYGDTYFALNRFAQEKIENSFVCEENLHRLAMKSPVEAVYEQMDWIRKGRAELTEIKSSYRESLREKFLSEVLEIKEFSKEDFVNAKEKLARSYRKELFPDIVKKDASFETKKLETILEEYDYVVVTEEKEGKMYYSVKKKEHM